MANLSVLVFLAFAAGANTPPLTVREVMENAQAVDGKEILLSGWIEHCRPLACILYASRREARRKSSRYWLSIGRSAWFDAFARRHGPGKITLRARFDARCVTDPRSGIIAVCTDRVNSLSPVAIAR
jgi:hypothetical protein